MSPQWILTIVLIVVVYFFFIKKRPLSNEAGKNQKKSDKTDEMVECEECGTYVSLDEALIRDGEYFCSNECLKA